MALRMKTMPTILNPFSWSLDNWFTALQAMSAVILGLTVAIGYMVNRRQALEIARAREEAGKANNSAAQATLRAEEEGRKRAELERSIAPRVLGVAIDGDVESIGSLRAFAGMQVIIEVIPEFEAQRAAGNIVWVLRNTGWNIINVSTNPNLRDGVLVEPYFPFLNVSPEHPFGPDEQRRDERRAREAADALVNFLKSNNWVADSGFPEREVRSRQTRSGYL